MSLSFLNLLYAPGSMLFAPCPMPFALPKPFGADKGALDDFAIHDHCFTISEKS